MFLVDFCVILVMKIMFDTKTKSPKLVTIFLIGIQVDLDLCMNSGQFQLPI
jgi:hypothetical protein